MLLIATDEAGYGPKLGPLAVVGTGWQVADRPRDPQDPRDFGKTGRFESKPGSDARTELAEPKGIGDPADPNGTAELDAAAELDRAFAIYRAETTVCRAGTTVSSVRLSVNDSKAVFKSGMSLDPLRALAAHAALRCGWSVDSVEQFLDLVDPSDWRNRSLSPWLDPSETDAWPTDAGKTLASHWAVAPAQLQHASARILPAAEFNAAIETGMNKADLLGEATMAVVGELLRKFDQTSGEPTGREPIVVFCDRQGGRRYYAGILQRHFPGTIPVIETETAALSRYRVDWAGREVIVSFTVKGDRFTPVAYSSMIAKWIREELMTRLNDYFVSRAGDSPPRRTAGYPVDADRFLAAIEPVRREQSIADSHLIRCR